MTTQSVVYSLAGIEGRDPLDVKTRTVITGALRKAGFPAGQIVQRTPKNATGCVILADRANKFYVRFTVDGDKLIADVGLPVAGGELDFSHGTKRGDKNYRLSSYCKLPCATEKVIEALNRLRGANQSLIAEVWKSREERFAKELQDEADERAGMERLARAVGVRLDKDGDLVPDKKSPLFRNWKRSFGPDLFAKGVTEFSLNDRDTGEVSIRMELHIDDAIAFMRALMASPFNPKHPDDLAAEREAEDDGGNG